MKKKTGILIAAACITLALAVVLLILTKKGDAGTIDINKDDPFKDISNEIIRVADDDIVSIEGKNFPKAPDYEVTVSYDKGEDTFTCTMPPPLAASYSAASSFSWASAICCCIFWA